jgi:hypothetical protein
LSEGECTGLSGWVQYNHKHPEGSKKIRDVIVEDTVLEAVCGNTKVEPQAKECRHPLKAEKMRDAFSPRASRKNQPCQYLDFLRV